jgi:triacylglycerol lipase
VIAHSFTGVDARAAISMHNADKHVQSLSTICSPHQGSRLVDNLVNDPSRCLIEEVEKAFEALGLSQKNVLEFTSENI